jgi:hypothetical protein
LTTGAERSCGRPRACEWHGPRPLCHHRSVAPNGGSEEAGRWERLDAPTKVVAALVGVAVPIVGAILVILGNPFSASPEELEARKSAAAVARNQIEKCKKSHELGSEHVEERERTKVVPILDIQRTFKRCEWPPPSTTSADGYTEIADEVTHYLHRGAALEWNVLHALTAPCERLDVSLVLHHMTSRSFRNAPLRPGPVYLAAQDVVNDAPTLAMQRLERVPPEVELPPPADEGTFLLLLNGHTELLGARCMPD